MRVRVVLSCAVPRIDNPFLLDGLGILVQIALAGLFMICMICMIYLMLPGGRRITCMI